MSKYQEKLSKIWPGQKIWATVFIPSGGVNPPIGGQLSRTAQNIAAGKPVQKQLIVLGVKGNILTAVYTTTFGSTSNFASRVREPAHWYPVAPAINQGKYPNPLPMEPNNVAQWICCSTPVTLNKSAVLKVLQDTVYSQESVNLLRNKVNEINGKNVV